MSLGREFAGLMDVREAEKELSGSRNDKGTHF